MLGQGNDPTRGRRGRRSTRRSTRSRRPRTRGQVRRFTGNDYLQDIQNGNFAACIAWSGDIVQIVEPRRALRVPRRGRRCRGSTRWSSRSRPPTAWRRREWMNFVYDPVNAAKITAYVQYISPVTGVRDELVKLGGDAAALAESPLLFPADEDKARLTCSATCPKSSTSSDRSLPHDHRRLTDGQPTTPTTGPCASRGWTPYLLSLPGLLFLYLFFLVPLVTLLKIALSVPVERRQQPVDFTWEWEQLLQGVHRLRRATVAGVRVRGGRHHAVHPDRLPAGLLHRLQGGPVAQPAARARDGAVLHQLPAAHHRLAVAVRRQRSGARRRRVRCTSSACSTSCSITTDGKILNTPAAVIGGLTYNFLPFALLPIYVSLEKIHVQPDRRRHRPLLAASPARSAR